MYCRLNLQLLVEFQFSLYRPLKTMILNFVLIIVIITISDAITIAVKEQKLTVPLDCVSPEIQSDYTVLISDNGNLAINSKALVRFTVKNLKKNVEKLHFKPSMYIFQFMDPDTLNYTLDVLVNSDAFKQSHFLLLCHPNVALQDLVNVLWMFKYV